MNATGQAGTRRPGWVVAGLLLIGLLPQAWAQVSVTLTAPPDGSTYVAPAMISLTASATATQGYKVSKVEFFHGTTLIGTDVKSPYSFIWSNVQPGNYTLTAIATAVKKKTPNQTVASAPVTITVRAPNAPPTVGITSPTNNASFNAPASVTLSATAADSDGSISKVEFFHGGTNLIATVTTAPYTFQWTNVQAGGYTLTAVATDNVGLATTSSPVSITVNQAAAALYFVHTDHLNTPRLITNEVGQAVWSWANDDPFGNNAPNENPLGLGAFTCNLRLPGQYFDKETNLHYNYFRDYDPAIGRYIQSDPIGLKGGINTFAYVGNNPLTKFDPFGLDETVWMPGRGRSIADGPRNGNWCGGNWSGGQVPSLNRGQDGPRGPVDSLDRCCMVHDRCYSQCDRYPEKNVREACLIKCDQGLVSCLRNLNDDCTRWPEPPRARTESDSQFYRDDALRHFDERIRRWDANNRSR